MSRTDAPPFRLHVTASRGRLYVIDARGRHVASLHVGRPERAPRGHGLLATIARPRTTLYVGGWLQPDGAASWHQAWTEVPNVSETNQHLARVLDQHGGVLDALLALHFQRLAPLPPGRWYTLPEFP